MRMMRKYKAQSTAEYAILIIIMIGALVAVQIYVKRGFQGRWKASVDDFGDQYDPAGVNSFINYSTLAQSNSVVIASPALDESGVSGFTTNRIDTTNSVETKQGYTTVGPVWTANTTP
jgi:hypothetical protein